MCSRSNSSPGPQELYYIFRWMHPRLRSANHSATGRTWPRCSRSKNSSPFLVYDFFTFNTVKQKFYYWFQGRKSDRTKSFWFKNFQLLAWLTVRHLRVYRQNKAWLKKAKFSQVNQQMGMFLDVRVLHRKHGAHNFNRLIRIARHLEGSVLLLKVF